MRTFNPYDSRVVQKYIENGTITADQYKDYLKKLPDETKNANWVEMETIDPEFAETKT